MLIVCTHFHMSNQGPQTLSFKRMGRIRNLKWRLNHSLSRSAAKNSIVQNKQESKQTNKYLGCLMYSSSTEHLHSHCKVLGSILSTLQQANKTVAKKKKNQNLYFSIRAHSCIQKVETGGSPQCQMQPFLHSNF